MCIYIYIYIYIYIGLLNPVFHRYKDRVASVIELSVCVWVLCVSVCLFFKGNTYPP